MRIRLTVEEPDGTPRRREVVVDCGRGTPASDLARALGGSRLSVDGSPVTRTALVGMPPLLEGATVQVDVPVVERRPLTAWELWVLDGPDVGLRTRLPPGRSVVGRAGDAVVRLTDPRVSRRHVEIEAEPPSRLSVRDLAGTNGTWVGGRRVSDSPRQLATGDVIEVGASRLELRVTPRTSLTVRPDGEGHLIVPAGRRALPDIARAVEFPNSPVLQPRRSIPWVMLVVPLAVAVVLAAVMRAPTMLLFGLAGPVLSLTSWFGERRARRRSGIRGDREHAATLAAAQAALAEALQSERRQLEQAHPPLAAVLGAAETPSSALWRCGGADVRIGVGTRSSQVQLSGDTAPLTPVVADAPVTVDLLAVGTFGVCGDRASVGAAAHAVLARLATTDAPSQMQLRVVVGDPALAVGWQPVARLPHARGVVPASGADRLRVEIGDEIARRQCEDRVRAPPSRPLLVVVLDSRGTPVDGAAWASVAHHGPAVGVVMIALADSASQLPPSCGAVLTVVGGHASLSRNGDVVAVAPELPGPEWLRRAHTALARLREPVVTSSGLADSVRLLDLVGDIDADSVREMWLRQPSSTRSVIGATQAGPMTVDLTVDGPHALIAGTTGSGKSELLQTLVCSLALANRPDELNFLLVDYKGGAAFRGCAGLPHVVGVVTDLDGHLTARALTSLTAELHRRERLFASVGAASLDEYRRARPRHTGLPTVPRLVIAIDEFRVLAEELPDFVHGIVRLAAVGRSLGIHLVLATQRPGGIVSADIRANVSLRIALRVRDRADSIDVLDDPDAASIDASTPGRATLRGATTPLTRFQSARVTTGPVSTEPLTVTPVGRRGAGPDDHSIEPPLSDPVSSEAAGAAGAEPGPVDLDRIVAAAQEATSTLHIDEPRSPWLPPLPVLLSLRSLGATASPDSVPLGLEDIPAQQAQALWSWAVADGHLGIAGGGRSGRTTTALTIAAQLASALPPSSVHLYAIGPRILAPLALLPHTAAVADVDDPEQVRLVTERLTARSRDHREGPLAIVLVDGWERVAAHAHGSLAGALRTLLETSGFSDLRAVVTGGRAVLAGQLVPLFAQRLVLPLADPVELALAGIPVKGLPAHRPPGRALDPATHREVQVATVGEDPAEALGSIARGWVGSGSPVTPAGWPQPVRRLPLSVTVVPERDAEMPTTVLQVGVRDGDLKRVGFDPDRGDRRILVVGPPGSGRTTALDTIAEALAASGYPLALVGARWMRLSRPELPPARGDRPEVLVLTGYGDTDRDLLIEARRHHTALAVVVDDVDRFAGLPIEPVLLEIARRVDEDRGVVAAAVSTMALDGRIGAVAGDLARAHTGVVLWPSPGTAILGIAVSDVTVAARIPGRGVLLRSGGVERIQVATVSRP